jgi:glycosyltransferase involved in cell wall biosynthesis
MTAVAAASAMDITVLVMTYNHERFIEQALDSALHQELSLEYEVLVSEDCSTDRTRSIVLEYGRRYPERIRLVLSERNLRSNEVVARGIRAARGRYIALLDGDDYWTSPRKLQTQARFLDQHPDCALVFHNAEVVDADGRREPQLWTPEHRRRRCTLDDLWQGNFIATASAMLRNGMLDEIPAWYADMFPITDWPLYILQAEHGWIGYLDEVMSVYRLHEGGWYSPMTEGEKQEATARFYRRMNANLGYRYDRTVRRAFARYFFEWAEEYAGRGDQWRARRCLLRSLVGGAGVSPASVRELTRLGMRLALPGIAVRRRRLAPTDARGE